MVTRKSEDSLSTVERITMRGVERLQKLVRLEAEKALQAGEPAREGFMWDTDIRNFGVRVKPSGTATFLVRYRIGSRRLQEAVGIFGSPWTVELAREKVKDLLNEVRKGVDPKKARKDALKAPTLAKLAERFLTEVVETKRKPATAKEYRRQLEKMVLPELGNQLVKDITFEDMSNLHHALRGTPVLANRLMATLSRMFNVAERWGMRPWNSNPCRHLDKYPERARKRFLSEAEFKELGKVLNQVEAEGTEGPYVVAALRLLIYTGARLGEILNLRWDQVDKGRRMLRLPDHKTSSVTGEKVIHLNDAAFKVLERLPITLGNPHVIAGRRREAALVNLEDPWQRIRARAGLQDVHIHDLRHSFAGMLASNGVSLPMIGALLGHTQASTTQRYAHLAPTPLKDANEAAGAKIWAAMGG